MSDPQKYRTKDEVATYEQKDPINSLVNHLIDKRLASQQQIDEMNRRTKEKTLAAVKYANESPDPPIEELYTDVYTQPFGPYKQGELPIMLQEDQGTTRPSP